MVIIDKNVFPKYTQYSHKLIHASAHANNGVASKLMTILKQAVFEHKTQNSDTMITKYRVGMNQNVVDEYICK